MDLQLQEQSHKEHKYHSACTQILLDALLACAQRKVRLNPSRADVQPTKRCRWLHWFSPRQQGWGWSIHSCRAATMPARLDAPHATTLTWHSPLDHWSTIPCCAHPSRPNPSVPTPKSVALRHQVVS